jgi:hypothetical protein
MRTVVLALALMSLLLLNGCARSNRGRRLPKPRTMDAKKAPVLAGKDSKVYHLRSCQFAAELSRPQGYSSYLEAERGGRIPCQFCNPRRTSDPLLPPATRQLLVPVPDP